MDLYKKNRSDMSYYGPVILLLIIFQQLKKLIAERLNNHLVERNLISPEQNGFRKGHSCVSALLLTMDS